MSEFLTLKDVCREAGVTRRTVQGYEQNELVSSIATNKYGHLLYDWDTCERIKTIKMYQRFGVSVGKIKEIFDLPKEELKKVLEEQLKVLENKLLEYKELIAKANEIIDEL